MPRLLIAANSAFVLGAVFYTLAAAQAQESDTASAGQQITQEQIQFLENVVQRMEPQQRQALQRLPREQQRSILLGILQRATARQPKRIKQWLNDDTDKSVVFHDPEHYPDASERIVDFVYKQTERRVEVVEIAFLRDGHDHAFNYRRLFRAKYRTVKDDKEYVADFLFEKKDGPYLEVKQWSRVPQEADFISQR